MNHFNNQIPILLEFRGMEKPVSVTLPQPVMRYLNIFAAREHTHAGETIYKQGERDRVMPACLLPRPMSNSVRP